MARRLGPILLLLSACGPPAEVTPPPPPRAEAPAVDPALVAELDALAAGALAEGPVAGLSVLVEKDGRTLLARGYGHADREAGIAASADTPYAIASISKQFTAGAVLRLAERGRLRLDDTLDRFVPELGEKARAIHLRQLLNHTSGIPAYERFTRRGSLAGVQGQILRVLKARRPGFAPGAGWEYSNSGFYLLGLVLERATGRPYAEVMEEELFQPLGLRGTGFCEGASTVPGRAQDYEVGRDGLVATQYWRRSGFFAGGGLCSTVADLARWQRALDEGRVLAAATLADMVAPTVLADGVEVDYGYGVRLGGLDGHRKWGHTGGGRSNRAVLARYPDEGLTVAVLMNTERSDAPLVAIDIEARLARRVLGEAEPSPAEIPLAPDEAARYAGEYLGSPPLRVTAASDGLRLRRGRRGADVRLRARGDGVFVNQEQPSVELRFLPAGAERARRIAIYDNGWFLALRTRR